jgi:hypothetical protein
MVTRALWLASVSFGLGLGACNWSVYDELADEAWVDRVTKPSDTDSRQYGVALVAMPGRTAGTSAFVLGKSRASLSTLGYDDEGKRLDVVAVDPRSSLQFAGFPDRPALAGDPDSDRVAFTVVQGENVDPTRVVVFDGRTLENVKSVVLPHPVEVDGVADRVAVYAEGVAFGLVPGLGMDTIKELAVARGPQLVLIQDYSEADSGTTFATKGCQTGADWSYASLIANVVDDTVHPGPEVLIATGEERRDDQSAIKILDPLAITDAYDLDTPCPAGVVPDIVSSEGAHDLGARLVAANFPDVVDPDPLATLDDLVYSIPGLNKVVVKFGGGTTVELAPADTGSDFGDAIAVGDVLDNDGIPELIIGAPRSDPESSSNGGQVYIYRFIPGATPSFSQPISIYPAEPKDEERFGKAVTVAPFGATGTKTVLQVGAEGEVFTYFRLTAESEDVRVGRTP